MSASTTAGAPEVIDLLTSDSSESEHEVQEVTPRARPSQRLLHRQTIYTPSAPDNDEMADVAQAAVGAQELPLPYLHVNDFQLDQETPLGAFPTVAAPEEQRGPGQIISIDGEEIFIPDSPVPGPGVPQRASAFSDLVEEPAINLDDHPLTADLCLARILEIFPDISHEHVFELYNKFDIPGEYEALGGHARYENIVEQLLSAESYPKQGKGKQAQKRKREEDELAEADSHRWERPDREVLPHHLKGAMQAMIKADFPQVPNDKIKKLLQTHQHFYHTYVAVAHLKDTSQHTLRGRPRSNGANADTIGANSGSQVLLDELAAARTKVVSARAGRAAADAKKRAEHENLQRAMAAGETAECQACFEELPMNRQMHCNGAEPHFTCLECAQTYIKSEVGESRCRVLCTAGCGAGFAYAQLHLLDDKKLLRRLEQLQQEKDIRDAGLDDLEECPFCDYKAILPPIEEDFEFRCANEECEKISCRRCKAVSHIPRSCEEYAQENKIDTRHKIEEAMTAAMLRSCNKCKKQFIKEYGCNKMSCPSCRNLQCYVCSKDIIDYNHFDQGPGGYTRGEASNKCPLYDNVEERHEREVKEAETAARAAVMAENPNVTEEDLTIKVSDAVNKATQDRIRVGNPAGRAPGFPMAYVGHMLGHGNHDVAADANEDNDGEDMDLGGLVGAALNGIRDERQLARQRRAMRQRHQTMRLRFIQRWQAQQGMGIAEAPDRGFAIAPANGAQQLYGPAVALQPPGAPRVPTQPLAPLAPNMRGLQGYSPVLGLQEPHANNNPFDGQPVEGNDGAPPGIAHRPDYHYGPLGAFPFNQGPARLIGLQDDILGERADPFWPAHLPQIDVGNDLNNADVSNNNNDDDDDDDDDDDNAAPAPAAPRRATEDVLQNYRQRRQTRRDRLNLLDGINEDLGQIRQRPPAGEPPNALLPPQPPPPQMPPRLDLAAGYARLLRHREDQDLQRRHDEFFGRRRHGRG